MGPRSIPRAGRSCARMRRGPERAAAASCGCRRCRVICSATATRRRTSCSRTHPVVRGPPLLSSTRPALTAEGQQSGIVVRKSGTTFSKFVFINKGSGNTRFEHIFTENQQGRLANADFTATLPAGFPKTVKVRVISDGETIRGEYLDGTAWKAIGRAAKIGTGVQVGVYAADNAADGPIVPYDSFALNAQSDEFAGDSAREVPLVADRARVGRGLPRRQRRARDRHRRQRGRRHGAQPDRPARPGRRLGGRDQGRPDHDPAGPAGRPAALQGEHQLGQGRARPHRRDDRADRVRARAQQRVPARRAVQRLRPDDDHELLPQDEVERHARHGRVLDQRHDVDPGRPLARHLRPEPARTSARWPCAAVPPTAVTAKFDYVRVKPVADRGLHGQRHRRDRLHPALERPRLRQHHPGRPGRLRRRQRRRRGLPPAEQGRPRPPLVQRQDLRQLHAAPAVEGDQGHGQLRRLRPLPEPGHQPAAPDRPGPRDPDPRGRRRRRRGPEDGLGLRHRPRERAQRPPGRRVERLRDQVPQRHVHDHAQRHGREHVHEHVDQGHDAGLHRPPEPRRRRRRLVPQRPRPGAGRGDEHLHHDRHHAGQHPRERPDPRWLDVHRRGDAAVRHGRRGAQRRRRRRPGADARHHGQRGQPGRVPRADADAGPGRPEELHQAAPLRHDGRRHRYAAPTRSSTRRARTRPRRSRSRTGAARSRRRRTSRSARSAAATRRRGPTARAARSTTSRSTTRRRRASSWRSSCRPTRPRPATRAAT